MTSLQHNSPATVDPFREWLKIDEPTRPLNPYQLLGLPELESNLDCITKAAQRQRARIDACRADGETALWREINDALQDAISLLKDARRKELCDASLRRQQSQVRPPEDAAGELPCQHCQVLNPASNQYCSKCGARLWTKCASCDETFAANRAYCGSCGVDLIEAERSLMRRHEETLQQAHELRENRRYDDALRLFRQLALLHDPRADALCRQATAGMQAIDRERSEATAMATACLQRAEQLLNASQYERAAAEVEQVPDVFRTSQLNATRDAARSLLRERRTLQSELKRALEEKRLAGVGRLLEQLRRLSPDANQLDKLAIQLASRCSHLARKCLTQYRYQEALQFLDEIPVEAHDEAVLKLYDRAREMAWLLDDIQQAAVVDKTVTAIARRLVKLTSHDARVGELLKRMEATKPPVDHRLAAADWSSTVGRGRLGVAVDWLGRPSSIAISKLAEAAWSEHPGVFLTACGLALQALGAAPIDTNLAPKEKSGLLRGFNLKRRQAATPVWGVDLGASSLKAVKLMRSQEGTLSVLAALHLPHATFLDRPNIASFSDVLQATVVKLREQGAIGEEPVCLGVSPRDVLGRFTEFPPLGGKKLKEAVGLEAKRQFPVGLEQLVWDFHTLETRGIRNGQETAEVQLVLQAAKAESMRQLVEIFRAGGVRVSAIQSNALALHNFICYDHFGWRPEKAGRAAPIQDHRQPTAADPPEAVAVLDIGAASSTLVVSHPNWLWYCGAQIAGNHFSDALANHFHLTFDQAQRLKHEPARAGRLHKMFDVLEPSFSKLEAEARRTLDAHRQRNGPRVRRLYGVGGGFGLHRVLRRLRNGS